MAKAALLLDQGNQRLKAALSEGPGRWQMVDLGTDSLASLLDRHGGGWISSSRPEALQELCREGGMADRLRVVDAAMVPLRLDTEGTGSDRLLAALAGHRLAGGAALVADLGTAWTLDLIDGRGVFRGGAIGAGLGLQQRALAEACPHLAGPLDSLAPGMPRDTASAVTAGTSFALAAALDALAFAWEQENGAPAPRFLCGGDASRIRPWLRNDWIVHPNLVLEGLSWVAEGRPACC